MRGAVRLLAAAAALAACATSANAAPASAATPRVLGTGHDPGVAVDFHGTAHVAWLAETGSGAATLEYCQVPRAKRSCAVRESFPLEKPGSGKVQVIARGAQVDVLAPEVNADSVLLVSADDGRTFLGHRLGELPAIAEMVPGPGAGVSLLSGSGPASYGRYGLDGSGPGGLPVQFGDATESLGTDLVRHDGGLAAFLAGAGGIRSALWAGAGDPDLQQNWVEGPRLAGLRSSPSAADGRSGTFLASVDRRAGLRAIRVARLKGARLRAPRRVSRQDPTELSLTQAPGGGMALVWAGTTDGWLSRSRRGTRWTAPRRLFRGNDPGDLHAALRNRGGWVVWDGSPGNGGAHPIRIAALPRPPRR